MHQLESTATGTLGALDGPTSSGAGLLAQEDPSWFAEWGSNLLEVVEFLAIAALALMIVGAVLVALVGRLPWRWTDWLRRHTPFLGHYFRPAFSFDTFDAPSDLDHLGPSVASLIGDEMSAAQPGGSNLEKASVDASADSVSTLGQSIPHAGALFALLARFSRARRYKVRGVIHAPTERRVSMTVEIANQRGKVVANTTVHDSLDAERRDDPDYDPKVDLKPFYLLAPRAAAWLLYTLHDISRFPNDGAWRKQSWHPTEGKLVLVGTPNWESYGYFRQGNWFEALNYCGLARTAYHEALAHDRRNIGALINLASLDLRETRYLDRALVRLDMADKLITADEQARRIRPKASENRPARDRDRELRRMDREQRRIDKETKRYRLADLPAARGAATETVEGPDGQKAKGAPRPAPTLPRRQILWYRVAYLNAVSRLHLYLVETAGDPEAAPPRRRSTDREDEPADRLETAINCAVDLIRNQATLLWTFLDRYSSHPRTTTPEEAGLVNLALQSELSALALLAGLLVEEEGTGVPPSSDPLPDPRHRWAYLATARREDLTFERVVHLLNPDRTISYRARYNLACAYGRAHALGRPVREPTDDRPSSSWSDLCIECLGTALDGGSDLLEWAATGDPGLTSVRDKDECRDTFAGLIADMRSQVGRPDPLGDTGADAGADAESGIDPHVEEAVANMAQTGSGSGMSRRSTDDPVPADSVASDSVPAGPGADRPGATDSDRRESAPSGPSRPPRSESAP